MKQKDINKLLERFLDGETTLQEERRLYAYFSQDDVPEELKAYQEMFRAYAAVASKTERKPVVVRPLWRRVAALAAAACLITAVLIPYTLYINKEAKEQKKEEVQLAETMETEPTPAPSPSELPASRQMDDFIAQLAAYYQVDQLPVQLKGLLLSPLYLPVDCTIAETTPQPSARPLRTTARKKTKPKEPELPDVPNLTPEQIRQIELEQEIIEQELRMREQAVENAILEFEREWEQEEEEVLREYIAREEEFQRKLANL